MKHLLAICVPAAIVLTMCSLVRAKSIKSDSDYKASTDLSVGAWTTIRAGTDYEMTGYAIADEFQLNLLYQAGILDSDIDNINHYWQPMGWNYNFGDNEEYILNVSAAGGLTIYEYDGLQETIGGTEIKWTLTGWHQTILAGDIIDNGDGTITLVVLPVGTYRPFIGDPPVNDVEIFDGDLNCEVLGYKFTGAIGDIGDGSVLSVSLAPDTISVPEDFTTIQAAINAANTGDAIIVAAGTYIENVTIGKANLTLQSESKWGAVIRPDTTPVGWPEAVIYISADGVMVDGFEIDGTTLCDNGILGWETSGLTIKNNKIHGAVRDWDGCGILLFSWGSGGTVYDNLIEDNVVYDTGRMGIMVMDKGSNYTVTSGNTITGNIVYDVWKVTWGDHGGGIQINVAKDCAITNNIVYNVQNGQRGIYMFGSASGNTITYNTIRDNPIGIQLWISGEGGTTIDWGGETPTSPQVYYNNIYSNSTYGAISSNIKGTPMVMDAIYNCWCASSGPYHPTANPTGAGDEVSDYVDFDPWAMLTYTGGPQASEGVTLEATVSNWTLPVEVEFFIVGEGSVGSAPTNEYGVASLNIGSRPVGVYNVYAMVGCLETDTALLAVYDPSAGFVTGGGWIWSPAGAYADNLELEGKANFGFVSKYKKGANVPTGNTEFVFQTADLNFHSSSYDWLVVTGSDYARFKGWGFINDEEGYRFMLWAGDGEPDTFRIKIWEEDELGVETVIYDNGMDQAIGGGSIVVHTK